MTENIQLSCHIYLKNDLGHVWSTTHYNPLNPLKHFILNEYRNNIFKFAVPYRAGDVKKFLERLSK